MGGGSITMIEKSISDIQGPNLMIERLLGCITTLALLVLLTAQLTFSQQRERNRAPDAAQKATPASKDLSAKEEKEEKDEKKEGDPQFRGMRYRSIGPYRGGRALAVTGVPGDPYTFYFGGVAGGVWKTMDGGNSWTPLTDKTKIVSIGAIAVAPSNSTLAPMRRNSLRCIKRLGKIFSVMALMPGVTDISAHICACMSVGKPG